MSKSTDPAAIILLIFLRFIEGEVRLTAVSDEFFLDNGTAAAWVLEQ